MGSERINCIAVDDGELSKHVFDWYMKNYHKDNDTIIFVHVNQMPQLPAMGLLAGQVAKTKHHDELIEEYIRRGKHVFDFYKKFCDEQQIRYEVVLEDCFDTPGQKICEVAKKYNSKALIIGQRGLGAFSRFLLGSTSNYVIHHSSIPVVVIPPSKKENEKH
ncbi:uncharacterized protein LOC100207137 [Hydra vulgaris]|uniref:uncharacterized protein LOC100207137 n=1 Tax=Hydra vulgaris TaxID=6087 RepID=UPI0001924A78|nr:universal stress protein A-like protein [Hydra vulgaris]